MIELHRHVMPEIHLLARRPTKVMHAAHLFEIADGHAFGPAAVDLYADVGLFGGEDARIDHGRHAACLTAL